jgi:arylsulfatase A-like enzyme
LGKLFNKLEKLKILSKTIIIIVSDHGHGFGEHESYGHVTQLYDEVIRIPMIIYGPGIFPQGKEISDVVSLVDIVPTVLQILGVESNCHFDGQNLLLLNNGQLSKNRAVFCETGTIFKKNKNELERGLQKCYVLPILRCIRTGDWKLILDNNDKPFELYDMKNDPGEEINLVESHREYADKLLAQFFKEGPKKRARDIIPPDIAEDFDEELKQQLQALGYF